MAFLQVGSTVLPIVSPVKEDSPIRIGKSIRMFSGKLRSSQRYIKRVFTVTTKKLNPTEYQAVRSAIIDGNFYNCTGDIFDGATIMCEVIYPSVDFDPADGTTFYRSITLVLTEV